MRGWRSADSGNFASRSWPDGNASAFTTSSRSLPTVGRGVLTAVIAARFITSIKEPEALTFNSNAWFGGSALVPGACYDVHLSSREEWLMKRREFIVALSGTAAVFAKCGSQPGARSFPRDSNTRNRRKRPAACSPWLVDHSWPAHHGKLALCQDGCALGDVQTTLRS